MIMEVTKRLFVGNLPNDVIEKDVRRLFEKFGRVDSLEVKTKKGVDGDVLSTFAFVDFVAPDAKLNKCLEKLNGSQVKGLYIRVQVAKENFLTRLQSERAASKNDEKSDKRISKAPPQPVQDYNPLEMFKSRKSKNEENEETVSTNKKKFTDADLEPEEETTGQEGSVLNKLENFSGMWKDLDTAPVVVEREANMQINIKEKKKSKHMEEKTEVKAEIKPLKKIEDPKKKELDNQKRIQSLQHRSEALKVQQNLIKSALSQTDSQKNKKIVFNFDDEEEESAPSQPIVTVKKKKKEKSGMKLFDEEEEEEDPHNDEERFKVKPHLEGRSGQELLELQSRFAHDDRFKLDERFADNEPEERMHVDDEPEDLETAEEKDRQLAILSSIVPMAPANASRKAKTIETTAFVRFDPTSKEHTRFEKAKEEKPATEKPKKDEKAKKGKGRQVEERVEVPLPEVSTERYYTTTSELKIGSGDSGGFSLLKMFRQAEPEEAVEEEEETAGKSGILGDPVETPKEEEKPKPKEPADSRATNYWKNVGMWQEPLFFQDNDSRLAEAMQFLRGKTDDVRYFDRSQWADQRDHLIRFYKNKMRRLDSRVAGLRKRPLESADQVDHFYGVQAAATRNKPKRTFFKKKRVQ